ncbi:restriction endonuclease [bacterium]|nr:restriction endonuclease [bacterium]MBU1434373.1 restriction endonuclease [bacterium]MBU1501951.1 restriction endonuclease [bacterium]
MKAWQKYQEDAAEYFRSIGLNASTDVTFKGVRTHHDIDVLVVSHYVGFDITWVVECKYWKHPVNKLHVLGLREIVADVGADRGILLSESGFQSGAIEAANLTNIQLTSLEDLRKNASHSIYAMRLRDLYDRVGICKDRYWEIPKQKRIEYELRAEWYEHDYSGVGVIDMCIDLLTKAFRDIYPFQSKNFEVFKLFGIDKSFESTKEVVQIVESKISELEAKLDFYDSKENEA